MNDYSSRGLRLTYEEKGEGEPLLLLHAFPLSGRMWDPQLGLGFRCIIPDLSGFGSSEATPEICRMSDLATDAAALLDHLGITERVVLGGLSMGGYAALAFAEKYPERLSRLILADTRAGADSPEARDKRLAAARDVMEKGSGILVEATVPKLLGASTRSRRPDLAKQVGQWIAEAPPAGVAAAQRGMAARPDRSAVLPRIAVPTLILVGEEDELTPPEESRRMAEGIPGSRLEILRGAGHLSSLEVPEDFNRVLAEFLS
jgi:3-oxoadipate enol-lactonase